MKDFLAEIGVDRFLAETPRALLARIENPLVVSQLGVIAAAGLIAFWAGARLRPALTRFASHRLPQHLAPGFLRVCASLLPPILWLAALGLAIAVGGALGQVLPFIGAASDLLLAWICIRVLSFAVKSPFASVAISLTAWSIAALSILGLLDPFVAQLKAHGLSFGDFRLSYLTIVEGVIDLVALLWLTTLLFQFLQRQIARSQSLTPSLQVLLTQLLKVFLPILAVAVALGAIGHLTELTVAFGALGLGVGLGLQRLVSNFFAGLTLLVGKTIKPGDIIAYKDSYGWVTAMGARYVTLRTRDGVEHLVPNDYFLENGVDNWSYSDVRLRLHVPVGIAYESDVRLAITLCEEAAKSVERVLDHPEPLCLLKGFGDSSIDLELRLWIEDPKNGTANVKSDVLLAVWDRFKLAGIKFPFPQRDVHIISGAA
jgi:small-conductance mechanosensitive channel